MRSWQQILFAIVMMTIAGCGHFFTDEDNSGSPSTAHFAYIVNSGGSSGSVSIFKLDDTSGTLAAAGSAATNTVGPQGAAVVLGKFLYVGSNGGGIMAYSINGTTGGLTQISGSPFAAGNVPLALSADPAGKFLYVANAADNTVSGFTIDSSSGALTPIAGMPVALSGSPADVKVDANGRFVFVAIPTGTIAVFALNATSGLLTNRKDFSPSVIGGQPTALVAEKTARFLYVVDKLPGVEPFSIDQSTGALTAISVPSSPSGTNPTAATTDSSGSFLYVTNRDSANISAYAILSAGNLLSITGSPFAASTTPQAIGVDVTGKFLYAVHSSGTIHIYSLNPSSGVITSTSSATAGSDPRNIVFK